MTFRGVVLVILALSFIGSSVVGVNLLYRHEGSAVQIIVARHAIPSGVVVGPDQLTTRSLPKHRLANGALTNFDDAVGRTTLQPLIEGEPVRESQLGPKG